MRIIIKESQYNVLLEQNNPNIQKAYNEIIKGANYPLGTSKDTILGAFNYIKTAEEFHKLRLMFKDKKTGYDSIEEMINEEYDRLDFDDIIKLQEKLYSIGVILNFSYGGNGIGTNFFSGGVKITYEKNFENIKKARKINSKCTSKYPPLLKQAQDYWIKWLSSPITKQKFRTNWNVKPKNDMIDGKEVNDIFEEYIDCINNLKLVFYDNTMIHAPGFSKVNLTKTKSAYAFVLQETPENVYVNCSLNDGDPLGTLIHEIQHLLYFIKPLNPSITIKNVFLKPGNKKLSIKDVYDSSKKDINNSKDLINASQSLGIEEIDLLYWALESEEVHKEDPGYICRETEKASNIQSVRHLLNIKPGQNITPQMLKPYINGEKHHTDISWILLCWASKGFKDINLFLSDLNKLAYQETNQTDNTRLT
jgi:hypothetical protein